MDTSKIAARLVALRGSKTQVEVAKALGIGQSTYAMYESGKRIPTDEIKMKIAKYFNCTVQEIFFLS